MRNGLCHETHAGDCQEIDELRRICCEEADQTRQAIIEELSLQQRWNHTTVSQMMAQIGDSQNKVKFLVRYEDPESGNSSGATHVPDQNSTILRSRTLPRCDSVLPRNTHNCTGIMPNVFARPPVQEGQPSTIFHSSKNLASSSQELGHDIRETGRKERKRVEKGTVECAFQSPHFESRSGTFKHTGGTCSHGGMMDYPRILITDRILENVLTLWNFKAGCLTSELKFVCEPPNLKSLCCGSKKLK